MLYKNRKYSSLSLLVIFLFISGCIQQPKEQRLTLLNIAFQEWVGYGLFYLAQEKGFLKDEGITLRFVDEQLDSARREAFVSGILDCEAGTIDLLVSKVAQGAPLVAVLELDHSFGSDGIVAKAEIKELKDLIGKRVAFSRDDVSETFLSFLFYKAGLSMNDITIVSRSPEEVADAFLNDEADAVVTWEPWITKALKSPQSHLLITSRDKPGIIIDTLNIREDIVKNNPRLVKGLMRAWFRALKYYKEQPIEASNCIAKYYKMSPQDYQRTLKGIKWIDYSQQANLAPHSVSIEAFNTIAEIKFNNGRILKKPNVQEALNYRLLERLYENSK